MPVSLTATTSDDLGELWRFLSKTLGNKEASRNFSSSAISWKYLEEHPWWPGGRSYIIRVPEGIAAHGCVCPVRFATGGNMVESMQIIDWAAGRLIPAGGVLTYRLCLELSGGTLLAIGGSEDTRKIIPQLKWFKRKADLRWYARPLRPWRPLARMAKGPREVARFARNLYWRYSPVLPAAGAWRCRRALPGEEVFSPTGAFIPMLRTRAWFDYLLRCPVAKTELVILEKESGPCGHAFLADCGGSVRVADFVLAGEVSRAERAAGFSALARYVAAKPDVVEIAAASSLDEINEAFQECGMRLRGNAPVYLADPKKVLPVDARLEITPVIGDAFYLFDPAYPFLC